MNWQGKTKDQGIATLQSLYKNLIILFEISKVKTPHKGSDIYKNFASIFNFLISILLIFVTQFEVFVIKGNQLGVAQS